jgi:hypothetical protein
MSILWLMILRISVKIYILPNNRLLTTNLKEGGINGKKEKSIRVVGQRH